MAMLFNHCCNQNVTDAGLPYLKSLENLQSLNLVGTIISAKGLASLQHLKKLTSIYLYQASVAQNDLAGLKRSFPKVVIDTGGYKLPFLVSDTTLVQPPKKT